MQEHSESVTLILENRNLIKRGRKMGLFTWIAIGAFAGWIANYFMDQDERLFPFSDIIIGILGAVVAKFVFSSFGADPITGFNLQSVVFSSLGAIFLIWFFRKKKSED